MVDLCRTGQAALAVEAATVLQIGEPVLLDDDEMARVVAKFARYGEPGVTTR